MDNILPFVKGPLLGKGLDREVYTFLPNPSLVIKIEIGPRFANILEWKMWECIRKQRKDILHLFAPCHSISSCGRILLQSKTTPLLYPVSIEVPSFMWDTRICNWGFINDQLVCHDYSEHVAYLVRDTLLIKIE